MLILYLHFESQWYLKSSSDLNPWSFSFLTLFSYIVIDPYYEKKCRISTASESKHMIFYYITKLSLTFSRKYYPVFNPWNYNITIKLFILCFFRRDVSNCGPKVRLQWASGSQPVRKLSVVSLLPNKVRTIVITIYYKAYPSYAFCPSGVGLGVK